MQISFDERAHKSFIYLMDNMENLTFTEQNLLMVILEILRLLSAQKADIDEYNKLMEELGPLIEQELDFRSRDTQGTV